MKIKKQTISNKVFEYLRDQIISQKLKSGDRIVESQVAKELGVSQAPVREALLQLEAMGLAESKPYVGCTVLPVNMNIIDEAYELRTMLEIYAVEKTIDTFATDDIQEMEYHFHKMQEALKVGDRETIIEEDFLCHEVIMKKTKNPMLPKMWRMTAEQWSSLTITYYDNMNYIVDSHVDIIKLLQEKNVNRLKEELKKHFNTARLITRHAFEATQCVTANQK